MPDESNSTANNRKIGILTSLSIPNFRLLLTGTLLSNAGQWIQQVTLSWLIYDLTTSGTILGSINLVRSIASSLMIPVAGVLIDRMQRRKLLMLENGWLFFITLTMGILIILGHGNILYLFIFALLGGLAQTIDNTLRQVLVFDLVPRSRTPNAVALIQTGWGIMRSFGPLLGGYLILWFGPGGNFLTQSLAYVLIVVTIMRIKFPVRKPVTTRSSPVADIKEGFKYLKKNRMTQIFMMMGLILPLFIVPTFSILSPVYAEEVFHSGEGDVLGQLMGAVGIGGILGGIVTASLGRFERRGILQLSSLFLLSLSLIGFAFSNTLWISLLLLALAGFFEIIFLTTNQTLLQLSIPDNLRGRVTGVVTLGMVIAPLGGLFAGIGTDLLGGPQKITMIMAGIAATLSLLIFLFSPTVRNYRLSQNIQDNPSDTDNA